MFNLSTLLFLLLLWLLLLFLFTARSSLRHCNRILSIVADVSLDVVVVFVVIVVIVAIIVVIAVVVVVIVAIIFVFAAFVDVFTRQAFRRLPLGQLP